NNWAISTANVPASFAATTTGTDPGFVNRVTRDLHLTKNAPCRNIGLNSLSYLDGTGTTHSGIPAYEYVSHQQYRTRRSDGQLDTGAYEYSLPLINSLRLNGNQHCQAVPTPRHSMPLLRPQATVSNP